MQYLGRLAGLDGLALAASNVHARQHGPAGTDVGEEESVLPLLDEASVVRVGRNMSWEIRERHEALMFGACKQMVLQSEDTTLSSAVLEQLLNVSSEFASSASQKSQWDKLYSMIKTGAEVRQQGRKQASSSWAKVQGPLLIMPPQGEASKHVIVSSKIKSCVERVQASEELGQFLDACQHASAGEKRGGNYKRRKLSSSVAASASHKSDSIDLQDLVSVAWEFCRAASSSPSVFSSRSRAIGAMFRGLVDEEGEDETAGRALVYHLGRDFSSQLIDDSGLHAVFLLACANALLLPAAQAKMESSANFRSDLRELVC